MVTDAELYDLFARELPRHPQVVGEAVARFCVLSELRGIIRENAPKLAGWMQAEVGAGRINDIVNQFITYCRNTADAEGLRAQVAGTQAIESIERTLRIKIAEGLSGDALLVVVEAVCDTAHGGFLAVVEPAADRFVGGVKKMSESVKDAAAVVLENMTLQCERILLSAGAFDAHPERDPSDESLVEDGGAGS